MDELIRGTTPSYIFRDFGLEVASISAAIFLILQGKNTIIRKTLGEATIGTDSIRWTLTQEESLKLDASKPATIRCKWRSGTLCGISESLTVEVRNFGDDEVI